MPGPPPYGRSSTVRWRSVAKSRGVTCSRASKPRSRARPTTPYRATGSTSSGNSDTTPIRYMRSILGRPIGDDHARVEIDLANHAAEDERNQPSALAAEDEHVVSAGREQVIDAAERLALH